MSIDLTTILGNLASSLISIGFLIQGFGYMMGILFVITGLKKLTHAKFSQEGTGGPIAYILGGAALIYLPTSARVLSNTLFGSTIGSNNILQYTKYSTIDLYGSIGVLVQTAGLIWFVRGAILLAHASEPGKQEGTKGLLFLIAGVLAMNISYTVGAINAISTYLLSMTGKIF